MIIITNKKNRKNKSNFLCFCSFQKNKTVHFLETFDIKSDKVLNILLFSTGKRTNREIQYTLLATYKRCKSYKKNFFIFQRFDLK